MDYPKGLGFVFINFLENTRTAFQWKSKGYFVFDDFLEEPINNVVPSGVTHIGFIAGSREGRFSIARPEKASWGTSATFAKERILSDESLAQTLRRCLLQFDDQPIESVYPVLGVWSTPNSTCFYFTGMLWEKNEYWETDKGRFDWVTPERIVEFLNGSKNEESKRRDKGVFDVVSKMCLSTHRRVMLMLRELHQMGFERLRAPSHAHNISWRCFIVPAAWTFKNHGGRFRDPRTKLAPLPSLRLHELNEWRFTYGGAQGQRPFDWPDVAFANPRELAERFIREFPDIAMVGWGPDKEYVEWYEQLLEATKPYRLFNSSGDCFFSDDYIFIDNDDHFRLPPPGHTDEQEIESYVERFSPRVQS